MEPIVFDVLSRHYGYRRGRGVTAPTEQELASAAAAGFPVGAQSHWPHDDLVRRARAAVGGFTLDAVAEAFVAGVGGSAPRGRQLLISFLWARHLPEHPYQAQRGACEVCGLQQESEPDVTEQRLRLRLGWAWNELPDRYVVDLEDAAATGVPAPTGADRAVLRALLRVAADMPAAATPGELEKRLARERVVPGTDKYRRYGVLEALAEAGVLPNGRITPSFERFVTTAERWAVGHGPARSDIVLPFGAWRGADGVDWARAEALFGALRSPV